MNTPLRLRLNDRAFLDSITARMTGRSTGDFFRNDVLPICPQIKELLQSIPSKNFGIRQGSFIMFLCYLSKMHEIHAETDDSFLVTIAKRWNIAWLAGQQRFIAMADDVYIAHMRILVPDELPEFDRWVNEMASKSVPPVLWDDYRAGIYTCLKLFEDALKIQS